jgi:hypothetical protein
MPAGSAPLRGAERYRRADAAPLTYERHRECFSGFHAPFSAELATL